MEIKSNDFRKYKVEIPEIEGRLIGGKNFVEISVESVVLLPGN